MNDQVAHIQGCLWPWLFSVDILENSCCSTGPSCGSNFLLYLKKEKSVNFFFSMTTQQLRNMQLNIHLKTCCGEIIFSVPQSIYVNIKI